MQEAGQSCGETVNAVVEIAAGERTVKMRDLPIRARGIDQTNFVLSIKMLDRGTE